MENELRSKNLSEQPWAEFADRLAKELIEHGATQAMIITRNADEDRVATNYYNCGYEDFWVLIGHLFTDIMFDAIAANKDAIKEILAEEGEE